MNRRPVAAAERGSGSRREAVGEREFRSAVDTWLVVLLGACLALPLVVGLTLPWQSGGAGGVSPLSRLAPLLMTLLVSAFVAWIFASTRYRIAGGQLTLRSGPFRWRIDVDSIQRVRPSRNPLSSPALSLNRLEIQYGRGRRILVSPAERDAFLRTLAAASSALELRGGALERRVARA